MLRRIEYSRDVSEMTEIILLKYLEEKETLYDKAVLKICENRYDILFGAIELGYNEIACELLKKRIATNPIYSPIKDFYSLTALLHNIVVDCYDFKGGEMVDNPQDYQIIYNEKGEILTSAEDISSSQRIYLGRVFKAWS